MQVTSGALGKPHAAAQVTAAKSAGEEKEEEEGENGEEKPKKKARTAEFKVPELPVLGKRLNKPAAKAQATSPDGENRRSTRRKS